MDEKKLQALARKNAAKAAAQQKPKAKYDDTISPANDPDAGCVEAVQGNEEAGVLGDGPEARAEEPDPAAAGEGAAAREQAAAEGRAAAAAAQALVHLRQVRRPRTVASTGAVR